METQVQADSSLQNKNEHSRQDLQKSESESLIRQKSCSSGWEYVSVHEAKLCLKAEGYILSNKFFLTASWLMRY